MTSDIGLLPHDIAAEQAVLGAMMSAEDVAAADVLAECLDMLTDAAFYRPAHQMIFQACSTLADASKPVDWLTVSAELERRGVLAQAGGPLYLNDCLHAVPAAANGPWYAERLLELKSRRDAAVAGDSIAQLATDPSLSAAERKDAARAALDKAFNDVTDTGPRSMAELLTETIEALESGQERGLPTGIVDLDALTGGLAGGELVFIGARPGMGKSLLAGGIARHVALKLGLPVLLSSLEMSAQEITLRLISATGRVPLFSLVQRKVNPADWPKINDAGALLAGCPLVIDDTPGMTLAGLRARLRSMARTDPARLVIVDYLGLMGTPPAENRQNAVASLSRGLKLVAREFGIPVIAVAQLNRRPEDRGVEHIPQSSDLRDSGAQEQDADIIILLNRPDAYEAESPRAGEIDLIVAKNRQGPKAIITCAFQGHYARIVDMAPLSRDDTQTWTPSSSLGAAS